MSQGQAGQGGVFFSSFRQIKSVRHTQTSCFFFFFKHFNICQSFCTNQSIPFKISIITNIQRNDVITTNYQLLNFVTIKKKKKNLNSIYRAFLPLFVSVA